MCEAKLSWLQLLFTDEAGEIRDPDGLTWLTSSSLPLQHKLDAGMQ